jgi:hypothetical protein
MCLAEELLRPQHVSVVLGAWGRNRGADRDLGPEIGIEIGIGGGTEVIGIEIEVAGIESSEGVMIVLRLRIGICLVELVKRERMMGGRGGGGRGAGVERGVEVGGGERSWIFFPPANDSTLQSVYFYLEVPEIEL